MKNITNIKRRIKTDLNHEHGGTSRGFGSGTGSLNVS